MDDKEKQGCFVLPRGLGQPSSWSMRGKGTPAGKNIPVAFLIGKQMNLEVILSAEGGFVPWV